jgi:hypothetical protein
MALSPERLAEWRSTPERAGIRRWENRTFQAARTELARHHPAEFLEILDRIRAEDPRPGTSAATEDERAA